MGFLDDAQNMINEHGEQVDQGLDEADKLAKSRFAGHDEQIDGLVNEAKEHTGQHEPAAAPVEPTP